MKASWVGACFQGRLAVIAFINTILRYFQYIVNLFIQYTGSLEFVIHLELLYQDQSKGYFEAQRFSISKRWKLLRIYTHTQLSSQYQEKIYFISLSRKGIYTLLMDFALARLSQNRTGYRDLKKVNMKLIMFKVNNKSTRTVSMTSFWHFIINIERVSPLFQCFYCLFEQLNISWKSFQFCNWSLKFFSVNPLLPAVH